MRNIFNLEYETRLVDAVLTCLEEYCKKTNYCFQVIESSTKTLSTDIVLIKKELCHGDVAESSKDVICISTHELDNESPNVEPNLLLSAPFTNVQSYLLGSNKNGFLLKLACLDYPPPFVISEDEFPFDSHDHVVATTIDGEQPLAFISNCAGFVFMKYFHIDICGRIYTPEALVKKSLEKFIKHLDKINEEIDAVIVWDKKKQQQ